MLGHSSPSSSPGVGPKPRRGGLALRWCRPWVSREALGGPGSAPGARPARGRAEAAAAAPPAVPQCLLALWGLFARASAAARRGPFRGEGLLGLTPLSLSLSLPLSISRKLLKTGRSLDAGPNDGRAGARWTTRGGCPPRLASSSGAAHGEPRQLPQGDGPGPDRRVRPRRSAAALSQDYTQSCSL